MHQLMNAQDGFFCHLAEPVTLTGIVYVHELGDINAINTLCFDGSVFFKTVIPLYCILLLIHLSCNKHGYQLKMKVDMC